MSREREGSLSMSLTILYVGDETELLTIFELTFRDDYHIKTSNNPVEALYTAHHKWH